MTHYLGGIWLVDVDSNGNILWNNTYGNEGTESPNAVCKATDGSIWIAAVSGSQGGEISNAYGNADAWFVHTDSIGNFINAKVLGSSKDDRSEMIYPLSNGNVIAGGYYSDSGGAFPNILYGDYYNAFLAIFSPQSSDVAETAVPSRNIRIYPNPAYEHVVNTIETK